MNKLRDFFKISPPLLTARLFVFQRIVLGSWLFIFYVRLHSDLSAILLKDGLYAGFPRRVYKFLPEFTSEAHVNYYLFAMLVSSFFLTLGFFRKLFTVFLILGWALLHYSSPLSPYPADGMLGWILIYTLAIPSKENKYFSTVTNENKWHYPSALYNINWFIFLFSILIAGLYKLGGASWRDGEALYYIFSSPVAYETPIREYLLTLPPSYLAPLTYLTLFIETVCPLLAIIIPKLRRFFWHLFFIFSIAFMIFFRVTDVVIGTWVCMIFLYDLKWLKSHKKLA